MVGPGEDIERIGDIVVTGADQADPLRFSIGGPRGIRAGGGQRPRGW